MTRPGLRADGYVTTGGRGRKRQPRIEGMDWTTLCVGCSGVTLSQLQFIAEQEGITMAYVIAKATSQYYKTHYG